ncbi:hypothetical protein BLD25_00480 [Candidatus Gracilibacteria bacterium GN02-872]|nr:hypothetical protein BLD25_00480 [Candidatus Gracilibacteria bacterium GN02-872]RKW20915.1 MAG: hypothetical protein D8B46_08670 [Candidatus Gracilibacteria bacterium]
MRAFGICLIVFGVIIIAFPAILVFLIGGFFIFLGINLITLGVLASKNTKEGENYVKFGNYKIYR